MKKVKNEQIANKLVDAIVLLKALKTRKQEEVVMIDVFLKDISDMLKDDQKEEKKEESKAAGSSEKDPKETTKSGSLTALVKPFAGKSLAERMEELAKALGDSTKAALKTEPEKDDWEVLKMMKMKETTEKLEKLGIGEMTLPTLEPYTGVPSVGGSGAPVDRGVADSVWCEACQEFHGKSHES